MMKKRSALKAEARQILKGKWVDAAAFTLLWGVIMMTINCLARMPIGHRVRPINVIFLIVWLLLSGPMYHVLATYFLRLVRGKKADLSVFAEIGKNFARNLAVFVYYTLFILIATFVLGMIIILVGADPVATGYVIISLALALSLVAGIYFSQVWFVMADQPKTDPWVAIKKSAAMMYAHEGYFTLMILSFIGWGALVVLTYGLAALFVVPYLMVTKALFYQEVRPSFLKMARDLLK